MLRGVVADVLGHDLDAPVSASAPRPQIGMALQKC